MQYTDDDIILSTGDMSRLLGVTRKTLTRWTQSGCPGRIEYGLWSVAKTLQWRFPPEDAEKSIERADLEYRKALADIEYREHRLARERLIVQKIEDAHFSKEDVLEAWEWRKEYFTKKATDFIPVLAAACHGRSISEIETVVEDHVRALLLDIISDNEE